MDPESVELALETPIYQDPDTGYFYYPIVATFEEIRAPRKIVTNAPPLQLHDGSYIDPKTNWQYFQVVSPEDFQAIRAETNKKSIETINQEKCDEEPIFAFEKKYYYPVSSVNEITERLRDIKEEAPPDFGYIQVGNIEEFEKLRDVAMAEREVKLNRPKDSLRPIYLDSKFMNYYYPVEAALEIKRLARVVLKQTPPMMFNTKEEVYVHSITKEKYVCVGTVKQFEYLRQQVQRDGKIPAQKSPSTMKMTKKVRVKKKS